MERRELSDISYEPHFEELKGTVPSVRLDTVLSVAYPLSRSKLTTYIEAAKVFVNGKLITNNGYHLNEGDLEFPSVDLDESLMQEFCPRQKRDVT